jgi:ketosteroid isomerase-like protein
VAHLVGGPVDEAPSVGGQLVAGIEARDASAIGACFADDVTFRALIPPGLREREGATDAAALIAGWFADSTELRLIERSVEEISDKLHVSYRLEGIEEGAPYVVEQHLYATCDGGKISKVDLLCSGFRPRAET